MNTIASSDIAAGVPMVPSWHELLPSGRLARSASRAAADHHPLPLGAQPIANVENMLVETWREARPIEIPRRQMAILAGDVVGYSRLIETDDVGTVARLLFLRRELVDPTAAVFRAALIRHTADAILLAFEDPVAALSCALTLQGVLFLLNEDLPQRRRIRMRMGLSVGQVLVVDGDVHGTGVNIAARLEALASAGEIYLCERAVEHVRHGLPVLFEPMGERRLHNISNPVRTYRVALDPIGPMVRQHAWPAATQSPIC
jgi:class 3 adenylate cyclase